MQKWTKFFFQNQKVKFHYVLTKSYQWLRYARNLSIFNGFQYLITIIPLILRAVQCITISLTKPNSLLLKFKLQIKPGSWFRLSCMCTFYIPLYLCIKYAYLTSILYIFDIHLQASWDRSKGLFTFFSLFIISIILKPLTLRCYVTAMTSTYFKALRRRLWVIDGCHLNQFHSSKILATILCLAYNVSCMF